MGSEGSLRASEVSLALLGHTEPKWQIREKADILSTLFLPTSTPAHTDIQSVLMF